MALVTLILGAILTYVFGGLLEKHKFSLKKQELLIGEYKLALTELLKIKHKILWRDNPALYLEDSDDYEDYLLYVACRKKSLMQLLDNFSMDYEYLFTPEMEIEITEIIHGLKNLRNLGLKDMENGLSSEESEQLRRDVEMTVDKFKLFYNTFKKKIIFEKEE